MPSWNIHIAQTERLLARGGAVARVVADRNAFLFGNLVPDIFVGYMVPGVTRPIPYRVTHFAKPEPIPKPREAEFWRVYVAPLAAELGVSPRRPVADPLPAASIVAERDAMNRVHYPARYADEASGVEAAVASARASDPAPTAAEVRRSAFDLTLGAWAHLLADNLWNTRVNEYLDAHGGKPGEEFRIKKQGDFDWFGKTLRIVSVPRATERLFAAAEAFPQYPIGRRYVLETIGVTHEIVRTNGGEPDHPAYRLLTDAFFDATLNEVLDATDAAVAERLA